MQFIGRLKQYYEINSDTDASEPVSPQSSEDLHTGSSSPDNWQTAIQTGKSAEEIRQDALVLSDIVNGWQYDILRAKEYYDELTANSDKYLHMYEPILIKGLSREKLESIALICQKLAQIVKIV